MADVTRLIFSGNTEKCKQLLKLVDTQIDRLKNFMGYNNLEQARNELILADGSVVNVTRIFGITTAHVSCPVQGGGDKEYEPLRNEEYERKYIWLKVLTEESENTDQFCWLRLAYDDLVPDKVVSSVRKKNPSGTATKLYLTYADSFVGTFDPYGTPTLGQFDWGEEPEGITWMDWVVYYAEYNYGTSQYKFPVAGAWAEQDGDGLLTGTRYGLWDLSATNRDARITTVTEDGLTIFSFDGEYAQRRLVKESANCYDSEIPPSTTLINTGLLVFKTYNRWLVPGSDYVKLLGDKNNYIVFTQEQNGTWNGNTINEEMPTYPLHNMVHLSTDPDTHDIFYDWRVHNEGHIFLYSKDYRYNAITNNVLTELCRATDKRTSVDIDYSEDVTSTYEGVSTIVWHSKLAYKSQDITKKEGWKPRYLQTDRYVDSDVKSTLLVCWDEEYEVDETDQTNYRRYACKITDNDLVISPKYERTTRFGYNFAEIEYEGKTYYGFGRLEYGVDSSYDPEADIVITKEKPFGG